MIDATKNGLHFHLRICILGGVRYKSLMGFAGDGREGGGQRGVRVPGGAPRRHGGGDGHDLQRSRVG